MDGNKILDFLIPQRVHDRKMNDMKTKSSNWERFNKMSNVDQITQILSWLKSNGYNVDPNGKFPKPDPKSYAFCKNMKVNGVNIQANGVKGGEIRGFTFMTRSKELYHVDISNWASMYVAWHEYPNSSRNCIHKVNSRITDTVLESYLIPEVATEGVGTVLGAICVAAIGAGAIAASVTHKKANKVNRQKIEAYLQTKNIDGSSDSAILAYQNKLVASVLADATKYMQKIVSNSKFKATVETTLASKLKSVKESMLEYRDDIDSSSWVNYKRGSISFKPSVFENGKEKQLILIDPKCALCKAIYDQEDNDDNAPEYTNQVVGGICEDIANAIIKKLNASYSEDVEAGLIGFEYTDAMGSPMGVPVLSVYPNSIPGRNGKYI